jgi:DNA-binding NtrC family response regulator
MTTPLRILLAEDDELVRITIRDALVDDGFAVEALVDGAAALRALERDGTDILITDVRLPGLDGLSLFRAMRRLQPEGGSIVITAFAQIDDAVTVMREGGDDYIAKPFELDALRLRVERLAERVRLRRALAEARAEARTEADDPRRTLVCESPPMQQVWRRVEAAAGSDLSVLISGETGVGKEICAELIHGRSRRAGRPFVHLNCAAIPAELFESEIFGHERGAFTGAVHKRAGRAAAAHTGTLFLDEVAELPLVHQAKLLRMLDSGAFEPVGSDQVQHVDIRVISATNRQMQAEVKAGRFRQDLLYRLNAVQIEVPPLRERRPDLPQLIAQCMAAVVQRSGWPAPSFAPAAMGAVLAHDYPGNVRELIHALEHGIALAEHGTIELHDLPADLQRDLPLPEDSTASVLPLADAIGRFEQAYIQKTLAQLDGRKGETAQRLGISRKSLWQKLRETGTG